MTLPCSPPGIPLLFVEDEPVSREQISRILKSRGFSVITAENGAQGLELYRQHHPELVVSDIMMPIMSGLEMSRAIRDESSSCQIIIMTAFNDTDYLKEAIDIGINQFVLKPVIIDKFLASIDHCLRVISMHHRLEELQEEQLRNRKTEAIGILAGGMAHDFNNILQVLTGSISLARISSNDPEKLASFLDMAEQSCQQATRLSQQLLSLSRGSLFLKRLQPALIINNNLAAAFPVPGIALERELPDTLHEIEADGDQLSQAFRSIMTNAVEAMPQGGRFLVRAENCCLADGEQTVLKAGDYVHISLSDSGVGIQPEILPHIFDPYFSTKRTGSQKGMGLGLTLSHSVIRKHKGTLSIDSQPGRGTTVHIYLPAAPAA